MERLRGTWWERRRDRELAAIVDELAVWGHEDLEDPGVAELAGLIGETAREAAGSHLNGRVPGAAGHLDLAAESVRTADAFRGSFLPQVVRSLSGARHHLRRARGITAADPASRPPLG
ncbi:hypothetical protein [Kitasatospora sp. DSM 101779]|uniref:hypothetical protein n=1 Tax=Kitasatospora sp. DSM 101779 TaxID=2853165 RepID=UPI0021D9776A|nr:hypothetical protein [Kitasatospora sp. DSM 101779]MCU7826716.1 hypothetical protein [Kitasatospora sp. DSM 101779]